MRRRFALLVIAAFLSIPALAAASAHDDTAYPDPAATWNGPVRASSDGHIEQGDVAYPGSHATIWKETPRASRGGALASADDTVYPALERLPAPARSSAGTEQRLACGCARR